MKKLIPLLGSCVFLVAGFALGAVGDSICHIQSKPGTCIETKDKDTIYVPNDMMLFGKEVSFCPTQYSKVDSIQLIIVLDQSGSMRNDPSSGFIGNDNNRDAIVAAQRLVDSVAIKSPTSMVGAVLFPCNACTAASVQGSATGFYPLKMTPSNANTMKMYIQTAYPYNGYGTPYGAGLDTALSYFNRLPAMPRTKRFVVFLSDGEPNGPSYADFLNAGKAALLPPTHTIYYHTTGTNINAQSTLIDLANRTGGTAYNASSVASMYAAFSDILRKIVTRTTIENFIMLNNATGQIVGTNLSDTSAVVMVPFEPLFLQTGINPIQFFYKQKNDTSTTISSTDIFKTVTIFRRPGTTTPAEKAKFDAVFDDYCFEKSSFQFTNSSYVSMPAGVGYDATDSRVHVAGRRGLGTTALQVDTVIVRSRGGDEERVAIFETGNSTDTYRGSVALISSATRTKFNNTLEVLTVDTLFLTYSNRDFYSSGSYSDRSYDTIAISLSSGITGTPQTSSIAAVSFAVQQAGHGISFQVGLDKPGQYGISVYDLQGRTVWSHRANALAAGTKNLSWNWAGKGAVPRNGIYFAVLKNGAAQIRWELVLVR